MLKTWLLVTTVVVLVSIAQAVTSRPNIIFVVADDLGEKALLYSYTSETISGCKSLLHIGN